MAKTPVLANTLTVFNTLSALKEKGNFDVSYHLAKSYEDVGLVVPVLDHSGPGRAKKSYRISEKGVTFLDRTRSAMEAAKALYMDPKTGELIHDPAPPVDINVKENLTPEQRRIQKLEAELEALRSGQSPTTRRVGRPKKAPVEVPTDANGNKIDMRTKEGRALKAQLSGKPLTPKARKATTGGTRESAELAELRKQLEALQAKIVGNESTSETTAEAKSDATENNTVDNSGNNGNGGAMVVRGPNGRFQKITKTEESAAA